VKTHTVNTVIAKLGPACRFMDVIARLVMIQWLSFNEAFP
jgi:hypothetical protein